MEGLEYYNRCYLYNKPLFCDIIQEGIVLLPGEADREETHIDGCALFLGHIGTGHYGNFLFDYLCRLWYVAGGGDAENIDMFVYTSDKVILSDNPVCLHILSYFGISKEKLIRVSVPTAFTTLIKPQESFIHDKYYSPVYCDIYKKIINKIDTSKYPRYEKIYFTRTQLSRHKEVGEKIFELFFERNGYKVLAPEKLSFEEQVSVVNNCTILASIEGTLAHNIIFALGGNCKKQIILKKQRCMIPRQFMINQACGIEAEYIEVYKEPFKGFPINYDRGPFLLIWNNNIKGFAKREGMVIPKVSVFHNVLLFPEYLFKCLNYELKHLLKKLLRLLSQR